VAKNNRKKGLMQDFIFISEECILNSTFPFIYEFNPFHYTWTTGDTGMKQIIIHVLNNLKMVCGKFDFEWQAITCEPQERLEW